MLSSFSTPSPLPSSIYPPIPSTAHCLKIDRTDRWTIARRLHELRIACWCLKDGSCWVDIPDGTAALLLRSVIQQVLAPRQVLITWLEQCWVMQSSYTGQQD